MYCNLKIAREISVGLFYILKLVLVQYENSGKLKLAVTFK